jgi:hypothetical protein
MLEEIANRNEQVSRLLQLPGFGVVTAVMGWAAIGNVQRLAYTQHLVSGLVYSFSEVLEVCLPTRKRKSLTRTNCCPVRQRLAALHLGQELTGIAWGSKKPIPLPPSANKVSDVPNTK